MDFPDLSLAANIRTLLDHVVAHRAPSTAKSNDLTHLTYYSCKPTFLFKFYSKVYQESCAVFNVWSRIRYIN